MWHREAFTLQKEPQNNSGTADGSVTATSECSRVPVVIVSLVEAALLNVDQHLALLERRATLVRSCPSPCDAGRVRRSVRYRALTELIDES